MKKYIVIETALTILLILSFILAIYLIILMTPLIQYLPVKLNFYYYKSVLVVILVVIIISINILGGLRMKR